jgi:hypothetical protein
MLNVVGIVTNDTGKRGTPYLGQLNTSEDAGIFKIESE